MAKQIAKSITDLLTGETVARVQDRAEDVSDLIPELLAHWSYDLYGRRPGPALLQDGALVTTDLDLACFLSALAQRGAVIVLPTYEGRRPKTHREGEHIVSAQNRHGKVLSLSANKDTFSMSVRIYDANVVVAGVEGREDRVGAYRNFMLVDLDGSWHDGWKTIQFWPQAKENDFLTDRKLWDGYTVAFRHFVHPNRWVSFYGTPYILTKILIERLTDEAAALRAAVKTVLAERPVLAVAARGDEFVGKTTRESGVAETVTAFEAEIDAPPLTGIYTFPKVWTAEDVKAARARATKLSYTDIPQLRFATRSTELAFYQAKMMQKGLPAWIRDTAWQMGYVQKGKRTEWNRLVLHQPFPGQPGYAIRYRTFLKTEQVAP